jgi:hypothetical protein
MCDKRRLPATATGTFRLLAPVGVPSPTAAPEPQHQAWPSTASAQVCIEPAAISLYTRPPATGTGTAESAESPLPSARYQLLPMHHACPFSSRPQACCSPSENWLQATEAALSQRAGEAEA